MSGWLGARLRMPSPAMIVALVALTVALGGTAVAATNVASIVNIADPTTPANMAKVDTSGALRTGGYVGQSTPRAPFFGHTFVSTSSTGTLIGENKATVALTRLSFENHYGQTNYATANV